MKRTQMIILAVVGLLLLGGVGAYYFMTRAQLSDEDWVGDQPVIANKISSSSDLVKNSQSLLSPADYANPTAASSVTAFQAQFDSLHAQGFFRVKAWDTNFSVVWANVPQLIGHKFPDDDQAGDAVKDGTPKHEVQLVSEGKADAAEVNSAEILDDYTEIYVPYKDTNGAVIGLSEGYISLSKEFDQVKQQQLIMSGVALAAAAVIYGAVIWAVRKFVR